MDRIDEFTAIVRQEIADYADGITWNAVTYPVLDDERQTYVVAVLPDRYPRPFRAGISVMARVVGDMVIIDEDITDRPLVNELVRAGIPREKIVLLYAGEQVPAESGEET